MTKTRGPRRKHPIYCHGYRTASNSWASQCRLCGSDRVARLDLQTGGTRSEEERMDVVIRFNTVPSFHHESSEAGQRSSSPRQQQHPRRVCRTGCLGRIGYKESRHFDTGV
jgi:hypothetical protein